MEGQVIALGEEQPKTPGLEQAANDNTINPHESAEVLQQKYLEQVFKYH
jgi:hypothetical protein